MTVLFCKHRVQVNTPKDARAITQVRAFIFGVRHTDIYIEISIEHPESQLRSLAELVMRKVLRCGEILYAIVLCFHNDN